MKEYKRKFPLFSLCGLNCGLCPRYQTDGVSKCPGCGGTGFHLKHPACAVITCNKKHNAVQYCFQCSLYPCEKYKNRNKADSFITYKNVDENFTKAQKDLNQYQKELKKKIKILEFLIKNYNDGRKKNFYCIAVNLLDLEDLDDITDQIDKRFKNQNIDKKEIIARVVELCEMKAEEKGIQILLRK